MKSFLVFFNLFSICFLSTALTETNIKKYLKDIDIQYFDSGMDKVDFVYVINLEMRPEKWTETRKALELYAIHPNKVNAINGLALREEEKQDLFGKYPIKLAGNEIGCLLSHLSILSHAFREGYEIIWVCEDDIEIYENPHQISDLVSILSKIDSQWDILYTDSDSKNSEGTIVPSLSSDFRPDFFHMSLSYYLKRVPINKDILKIHQRFGSYSMIISKRGIEKIFNHFVNNHLWSAYDIDIHYIPGIRQYCVNRDLVSIDYRKHSDIEEPRKIRFNNNFQKRHRKNF